VLEWYLRTKLRLENNYVIFDKYLPKEGQITDIGCGYGYMDYMLYFMARGRKITAIDYDAEKIEVAANCSAKNEYLEFFASDIRSFEIENSRGFILSDVLHYMPEDEQEILLTNCIRHLESGGVILIRDADSEQHKKHFGTMLTELFSTLSGFNKTLDDKKKLFFSSREKIEKICHDNGMKSEVLEESRHTSNLLMAIKKMT
jgi:trans-aconitate methyltransferase